MQWHIHAWLKFIHVNKMGPESTVHVYVYTIANRIAILTNTHY